MRLSKEDAIKSLKTQLLGLKRIYCYIVGRSKAGHMYCNVYYCKDEEMYSIDWELQSAMRCHRSKRNGSIRVTPDDVSEWLNDNIQPELIVRRIN